MGYLEDEIDTEFSQRDSLVSVNSIDSSNLPVPPLPKIQRASSCPPMLSCFPSNQQEDEASTNEIDMEDKRFYATYDYYTFYYSKNPIDTRLPKPMCNFSNVESPHSPPKDSPASPVSPLKTHKHASIGSSSSNKDSPIGPSVAEPNKSSLIRSNSPTTINFSTIEKQLPSPSPELESSKKKETNMPLENQQVKKNAGDVASQQKQSWYTAQSAYRHGPYTEDYYNWNRASYGQYSYWEDNYYYSQRSAWEHEYPQYYPQYGYNQHKPMNSRWKTDCRYAALIEDLKAKDTKSLKELVDRELLLKIIKSSEGSRYIQLCMDSATEEEKRSAFDVLCPEIKSLCTDPFANYVIQKFFDKGNAEHRPYITLKLMGNVFFLSQDMYGCRVIQKAIDYAGPDTLVMLVQELNEEGGVTRCIYNQNGNHVIQKCIETAEPYVIPIIMQSFKDQIVDLSQHVYGCRVVQKLIKHCDKKMKIPLIMQILPSVESLSYNEFGNYVVQYLLEHGEKRDRKSIIQRIQGHIKELSKDKYGSNVVEKSFMHGTPEDQEKFIDIVLNDNSTNPPVIDMMKDQYGNYVIQKIIEESNQSQLTRIIKKIRSFGLDLSQFPFGKYTLARIEQLQTEKLEESMLPN